MLSRVRLIVCLDPSTTHSLRNEPHYLAVSIRHTLQTKKSPLARARLYME